MHQNSGNIILKTNEAAHEISPPNEVKFKFPNYEFRQINYFDQDTSHTVVSELKLRADKILFGINQSVFNFICEYINVFSIQTLVVNNRERLNFIYRTNACYNSIINLIQINSINRINKLFESTNKKLFERGVLFGVVETKDIHKQKILNRYPLGINYLVYSLDYLFKRIAPKLKITKKLYFYITKGRNRVITKAEIYGRLYCCGFELLDERIIEDKLYFIAQKKQAPIYPKNPSYGFLIRLPRIGKNGRLINFYKIRTMHPYSEFLQEYLYKKSGLQPGGKINSDFRISNLGKIFRKYWIDELPMLINFLKGDIKIVGVRPLSAHYFSLYTQELQELRIKAKPGLIPPFYVDFPKTLEEIMESEFKYLDQYFKKPLLTDVRYFIMAIYNIIFRKYRSR